MTKPQPPKPSASIATCDLFLLTEFLTQAVSAKDNLILQVLEPDDDLGPLPDDSLIIRISVNPNRTDN